MIQTFTKEIQNFLESLPEVKSCRLYGSLSTGTFDEYSDIDLEIDISGIDNGKFVLELPEILASNYDVIFYDYAPSLAPEKYIVSIAMNAENPFMVVDITCTATPHCDSVSKQQLSALNNAYDHTLKLFTANLKHFLRGMDCYDDILKMYGRIFGRDQEVYEEEQMLNAVFQWLKDNADAQHEKYLASLSKYL